MGSLDIIPAELIRFSDAVLRLVQSYWSFPPDCCTYAEANGAETNALFEGRLAGRRYLVA